MGLSKGVGLGVEPNWEVLGQPSLSSIGVQNIKDITREI